MGWQDRDYAKWTDDERAQYVGGGTTVVGLAPRSRRRREVTALAMLVSLGVSVVAWHLGVLRFSAPARTVKAPVSTQKIVYGTGRAHTTDGADDMTCTAMTGQSCTTWTILLPGELAVPAAPLPAGVTCPTIAVDQTSGRWVCG